MAFKNTSDVVAFSRYVAFFKLLHLTKTTKFVFGSSMQNFHRIRHFLYSLLRTFAPHFYLKIHSNYKHMKKTFLLFSLAALFSGVSLAQNIKFVEYDLPNGLKVLLHEDHTTPIVAVSVMYHVGSKNEKPQRQHPTTSPWQQHIGPAAESLPCAQRWCALSQHLMCTPCAAAHRWAPWRRERLGQPHSSSRRRGRSTSNSAAATTAAITAAGAAATPAATSATMLALAASATAIAAAIATATEPAAGAPSPAGPGGRGPARGRPAPRALHLRVLLPGFAG